MADRMCGEIEIRSGNCLNRGAKIKEKAEISCKPSWEPDSWNNIPADESQEIISQLEALGHM